MKLVSKEKRETIYTLEVTERELTILKEELGKGFGNYGLYSQIVNILSGGKK